MVEYYSIAYMYHIFFIHSSAHGHLDCLHVLVIANSAAMNIGVHMNRGGAPLIAQLVNNLPVFLGQEDPLEKGIGYPIQYSWASLVAQQ